MSPLHMSCHEQELFLRLDLQNKMPLCNVTVELIMYYAITTYIIHNKQIQMHAVGRCNAYTIGLQVEQGMANI